MLAMVDKHGQQQLTLDEFLQREGQDIKKQKISDYYSVRDGNEFIKEENPPQKLDYFDGKNTIFVSDQELDKIVGLQIGSSSTVISLENRFQFKPETYIVHYDWRREGRLPEQTKKTAIDFEGIHGIGAAIDECVKALQEPKTNTIPEDKELENEDLFIQNWIRQNTLHILAKDGLPGKIDKFRNLTRITVEKCERGEYINSGVCIGRHGFNLSWNKDKGYVLKIGEGSKIGTLQKMATEFKKPEYSRNNNNSYLFNNNNNEILDMIKAESEQNFSLDDITKYLNSPEHDSLWGNYDEIKRYKEKFLPISESENDLYTDRDVFIQAKWKKGGNKGTDKYIDDRMKDWNNYSLQGRSTDGESSNIRFWKERLYEVHPCMIGRVRPSFVSGNANERQIPLRTYRLIKQSQETIFGKKPDHWGTTDFVGNCLFLCPDTFARISTNENIDKYTLDPEHLIEQLNEAYCSVEFATEGNVITVKRALSSSEDQNDDPDMFIDKFHLLEMLAFLEGTKSLRK